MHVHSWKIILKEDIKELDMIHQVYLIDYYLSTIYM